MNSTLAGILKQRVPRYNNSIIAATTPDNTSSTTPPSNTPSSPSSSSSTKKSVSRGTIAGAVIGAIVGVALISLAAYLIFRHRRQKNQNAWNSDQNAHGTGPKSPPMVGVSEVHEMQDQNINGEKPAEKYGRPIVEADERNQVYELPRTS